MKNTLLLVLLAVAGTAVALDNGLGLTPQMGFNTWNHFGCNINETLVYRTIDALVSSGLAGAGYNYVNLDDCWQKSRDSATGVIVPDPSAFPHGIRPLADYAHSKGLRFGLYSDAGLYTCQRRPGGLHHEAIDAKTYAAWQVDYLKYDNCWAITDPKPRYEAMRDALNASGRKIFFSMCEWGVDKVATWGRDVGNSWRTTLDISDTWKSMLSNIEKNDKWASYAGPGGWNDPDMLEVGNGGLNDAESRAHFSLWALAKAPLLVGCDISAMSAATKEILLNSEVIAVDQDPLGVQGKKVADADGLSVWAGPLQNDAWAVVMLNTNTAAATFVAKWIDIGIPVDKDVAVRDLWAHKDLGTFNGIFSARVEGHSAEMFRFTLLK